MTLSFLSQEGSVFLGAYMFDSIWANGTSEQTGSSWTVVCILEGSVN